MNPTEFANLIRQKYPNAYNNVPDVELAKMVVSKYPVYASQVKFDTVVKPEYTKSQKAVSDFIGTTKLGEGLGVSISNALGTQKDLTGAQDSLMTTQNQLIERIKTDKQAGKDTTRLESALKSLTEEITNIGGQATEIGTNNITNKEVLGSALKTGTSIAAAAMPVASSIGGKALQFGAVGAVGGAADAMTENKTNEEIVKDALKSAAIGAGTGIAFGAAEKGVKKLGDLVGKWGDRIQTSVIKPSQADIKDGFNIETVKKFNLGGSLKTTFEKTESKLDELSKQLNEKIQSSNSTIDLNTIYENTAKRLLGSKMENFGSNKAMETAIDNLRNEIIASAGPNGIASLPEAQLIKRASGHYGAWTYGVPTPEATASQKVYSTFYNEMKTAIEKNSPKGVREINKQISELIPVMNAVIRRIPVAERNSAISLTDIITLSASALEPRALALSLLNFASKRGEVGKVLSNAPKAANAVSNAIKQAEPVGRLLNN